MTHYLKCDPEPFRAVKEGKKRCEIRKNDRHFNVGDTLVLQETVFAGHQMALGSEIYPLRYSKQEVTVTITHIIEGPSYGIAPGYVALSIDS